MEKIKITEIAQEVGATSKDVYKKAIMMSISVKSTRSSVSIEEAQKIFDAILYNKEQKTQIKLETPSETIEEEYSSFYKKGKPLQRVIEIGKELNKIGGFDAMFQVGSTIEGINQRELDLAWSGIGTWMG